MVWTFTLPPLEWLWQELWWLIFSIFGTYLQYIPYTFCLLVRYLKIAQPLQIVQWISPITLKYELPLWSSSCLLNSELAHYQHVLNIAVQWSCGWLQHTDNIVCEWEECKKPCSLLVMIHKLLLQVFQSILGVFSQTPFPTDVCILWSMSSNHTLIYWQNVITLKKWCVLATLIGRWVAYQHPARRRCCDYLFCWMNLIAPL